MVFGANSIADIPSSYTPPKKPDGDTPLLGLLLLLTCPMCFLGSIFLDSAIPEIAVRNIWGRGIMCVIHGIDRLSTDSQPTNTTVDYLSRESRSSVGRSVICRSRVQSLTVSRQSINNIRFSSSFRASIDRRSTLSEINDCRPRIDRSLGACRDRKVPQDKKGAVHRPTQLHT